MKTIIQTIILSVLSYGFAFAQQQQIPYNSLQVTGANISASTQCAVSSSSGTAYVCATTPNFTPVAGSQIIFTANLANTSTAATLAVNGATAAGIKIGGSATLTVGQIKSGEIISAIYDGTNWQLLGSTASGGGSATTITPGANITVNGSGSTPCSTNCTIAATAINFLSGVTTQVSEGDSITAGTGSPSTAARFANQLASFYGLTLTNRAIPGSQACDVATGQALANDNPGATGNPLYTLMIGTNDALQQGLGTYEAVYKQCHQATIAWEAIPSTDKVFAQASGCVQAGTWANDSTYQTGIGLLSTTNASTLTCTITTTGGPVYAWYQLKDGSGGTFTYALDGGSTTSVTSATTPAIATVNGGTTGIGLIRVPIAVGSAGSHSLAFTVTSATNSANTVLILGIGTAPTQTQINTPTSPVAFVAGVPRANGDYSGNVYGQYERDAIEDINLLASDGLPVYFVPERDFVCTYFTPTTCYGIGGTSNGTDYNDDHHPNNIGETEYLGAFLTTIQSAVNGAYRKTPNRMITTASQFSVEGSAASGSGQINTGYLFNGVNGLWEDIAVSKLNTAIGPTSMPTTLTSGGDNTAGGNGALNAVTSGNYNTAFGVWALENLATGSQNTAVGLQCGVANVSATGMSCLGWTALQHSTVAGDAFGSSALAANTNGINNSAFGFNSLVLNTTGQDNTAVGNGAISSAITASANTAVGSSALKNTTGQSNTALGFEAGENVGAGSGDIMIGERAEPSGTGDIYETVVGAAVTGHGSHTATIGMQANSGSSDTTYVEGLVSGSSTPQVAATGSGCALALGTVTGNNFAGTIAVTGSGTCAVKVQLADNFTYPHGLACSVLVDLTSGLSAVQASTTTAYAIFANLVITSGDVLQYGPCIGY